MNYHNLESLLYMIHLSALRDPKRDLKCISESQIVGMKCYEFCKFLKVLISSGVDFCPKLEIIYPDKCNPSFRFSFIQRWNLGKGQPCRSGEDEIEGRFSNGKFWIQYVDLPQIGKQEA